MTVAEDAVPYYLTERYKGTAPIKSDFILWDRIHSGGRAEPDDDAAEAEGRGTEPQPKRAKRDKPKRNRGQNKARSFTIAKDTIQLCSFVARERQCPRPQCKFSHDLKAYLALKDSDVEYDLHPDFRTIIKEHRVCPLFAEIGGCPYGYKCRFLDSHVEKVAPGKGFQGTGLRLKLSDTATRLNELQLNSLLDTKGEQNVVGAETRGKFRPNAMATELPGAHAYLTEIGATLQDLEHSRKQHQDGRQANGHGRKFSKYASNVSTTSLDTLRVEDDGTPDNTPPSPEMEPNRSDSIAEPVASTSAVSTSPIKDADSAISNEAKEEPLSDGPPDVPMRALEKRRLDFRDRYYLAPLTTVGNLPFRRLCGEYGADVTCGEMGLAAEYISGNPSEWALLRRHTSEKTFGVQVCGSRPHHLVPVAEAIVKTCPDVDFVDVNCGCPIDLIVKKGAGSALLEHPAKLGKSLVGMSRVLGEIPLTIKLRTGVRDNDLVAHKLVSRVRGWGVGAVTLHGRTRQQRYSRMADYDYIRQCVAALRSACEDDDLPRVPFIGNGDAYDHRDFWENIEMTGVDTVMVARGALVKPWIFTELRERRDWDISARERLDGIQRLANYGLAHWGTDTQGLSTTRRFLCEALSFQHRYVPVGLLERLPARLNLRPLQYRGRDELETLLSSDNANDWDRIASMFLGPPPKDWDFTPKHKSNSYSRDAGDPYEANG